MVDDSTYLYATNLSLFKFKWWRHQSWWRHHRNGVFWLIIVQTGQTRSQIVRIDVLIHPTIFYRIWNHFRACPMILLLKWDKIEPLWDMSFLQNYNRFSVKYCRSVFSEVWPVRIRSKKRPKTPHDDVMMTWWHDRNFVIFRPNYSNKVANCSYVCPIYPCKVLLRLDELKGISQNEF